MHMWLKDKLSVYKREIKYCKGGETGFMFEYVPGFVDVFKNGKKLIENDDFTAKDGERILLTDIAEKGDTFELISWRVSEITDKMPSISFDDLSDTPAEKRANFYLKSDKYGQKLEFVRGIEYEFKNGLSINNIDNVSQVIIGGDFDSITLKGITLESKFDIQINEKRFIINDKGFYIKPGNEHEIIIHNEQFEDTSYNDTHKSTTIFAPTYTSIVKSNLNQSEVYKFVATSNGLSSDIYDERLSSKSSFNQRSDTFYFGTYSIYQEKGPSLSITYHGGVVVEAMPTRVINFIADTDNTRLDKHPSGNSPKAIATVGYVETVRGHLAKIEQDGKIGYRISGRSTEKYLPIGGQSVDLSYNLTQNQLGVNGDYSFGTGLNTLVTGQYAYGGGYDTQNNASYSFMHGRSLRSNKNNGFTAFGQFNNIKNDTIFEVGIGENDARRVNGFEISTKGVVTLPQHEIAVIDESDQKVAVTKEWVESKIFKPGKQEYDFEAYAAQKEFVILGVVVSKKQMLVFCDGMKVKSDSFVVTDNMKDTKITFKEPRKRGAWVNIVIFGV